MGPSGAWLSSGRALVAAAGPRQVDKKTPEGGPGLENAMRVVLVRRGATREAYADRDRGAMPGAT